MNIDEKNGTTILRRSDDYKPRKSIRTWLIGRPLSTSEAPHQTIGKLVGLAVFSSDALSSVAYATQEMLVILALAGMGAFHLSLPISLAIVALLAILTLSYEQTIHAYPNGGGSYIVARDNLGTWPALTAAAALLIDYILTVSVSISSGVAQVTSAFPVLFTYRVEISIVLVLFVMLVNLRGVKESGMAFSVPTYIFILMMFTTIIIGGVRYFSGNLPPVVDPPELEMIRAAQPLTFFLILKAFASGTSAITGVEAISDGILAFKEPRSKNAGTTLIWMAFILGTLLVGITFLSNQINAVPSETETVISQLARTALGGRNFLYLATIVATTVILVLAANTAFADFPRLSAFVAADGFLPRQMAFRGSRLVYSRGIVALAIIACLLIVAFQASVTKLIPLYAVGVFLSFTLSQAGMARRWWKSGHLDPGGTVQERGSILRQEKSWLIKMIINAAGAITTAIVMMVFAMTKFRDGAWIVIFLIPTVIGVFAWIHRHYRGLASNLSLDRTSSPTHISRQRVLIPVSGMHRGTLQALRYARTISDDITAVHVSIDQQETEKLQKKWDIWGEGYRLVILESPYRLFIEPLLNYIVDIDEDRQPNEVISIIVPQFVPKHWWNNFMHARAADTLRKVLLNHPEIVITEVPYQVD